ncbi:MAG: ABC transporter substrate-binding protein [Actinobacteria bacterium]|nr:ABC transporter substrate-binding protein [Actinomycetota bacterium]
MSDRNPVGPKIGPDLTRRKLLQGAGTGLLVVGGGSILAACGGGGSGSGSNATTNTAGTGEGKPKAGGVLRVGAQGGSNTDTLDAHNILTNTDYARGAQLYDSLIKLNTEGQPELSLAESIEPNKTATEWTIKLKKGLKFHDGKPCTAKDVLFTFNRIITGEFPASTVLNTLDLKNSKVIDELTLLVKFSAPYAIFSEALAGRYEYCYIVPVGYNPKKPIGCGPFKLKSFTPGRESVTLKFDEYWDQPKPYLDEIRTININEETAQVSALQAGQVDCIDYLTAASISTLEAAGLTVSIAETGGWSPICMMTNAEPFMDNQVRQAMRLAVNRKSMLESVFAGNGNIANDVFGRYTPGVENANLPQREQDIEKAESLLKKAGKQGLSVSLYSTEIAPGMNQTAEVLGTQAAAAGMNVKVVKQPTTEYFARSYLKVPFGMDWWAYEPYLVTAGQATVKGAPYNYTAFHNEKYNKLYAEAVSTTDQKKQEELTSEMVTIDYEEGGYIIPYNFPIIDSWASNVHGIKPSVLGQALSNFQFQNFWLT